MEESAMGDFANRLKQEFEDRDSNASDGDECQDWFVNDSPKHESVAPMDEEPSPKRDGTRGATVPPAASPATRTTRSVSSPAQPATKTSPSDTKTITDEASALNLGSCAIFVLAAGSSLWDQVFPDLHPAGSRQPDGLLFVRAEATQQVQVSIQLDGLLLRRESFDDSIRGHEALSTAGHEGNGSSSFRHQAGSEKAGAQRSFKYSGTVVFLYVLVVEYLTFNDVGDSISLFSGSFNVRGQQERGLPLQHSGGG
ncbi:hypothetical protein ON010_g7267 [Phytophthora cinnamomi]|nr:hypothetical protein ON010_g7267 [Phytophthora cinnamomi]